MRGKINKLNKATVAAVLASSGVLSIMPPVEAYGFKDLNPHADYYKPILDLSSRGILSGYSDGTFRPNQAITRGEASKMLALALNLNTTNPKNPGFKDVPFISDEYRYIAALVNEGIISGFADGTFKPNELITRGQMAKMLAVGYQLGIPTKINMPFTDISDKNTNAPYIQTLYELNITKGKTAVTYDVYGTVTRGQMATFIWRIEQVDKGEPAYNVGGVQGNTIYINNVPYTVASNLQSIINNSNAAILKGAVIEGTFNGKTLTNIQTLTLNASGTSNRLLALDANNSSFAGELVVNGSYVRLKNWHLTGRVTIAEAPRQSLAKYTDHLKNIRIASLSGVGFIDWSQPTVPEQDQTMTPTESETPQLKPIPEPNAVPTNSYTERMANVKGYVDFENTTVADLRIEKNRTFVKSNRSLNKATLAGDVEAAEFYANMTTLYVDTDRDTTVYGVGKIETIYKNNRRNFYINTNSYIDFMYVDNTSGWIDLGDFVIINKLVLPKGSKPNHVLKDFVNDNDKIAIIVDPDGLPIDRDEEDKDIPDETRPIVSNLKVTAQSTSATATFTSNENGTYYYAVRRAAEQAPTVREIMQENVLQKGQAIASETTTFTIDNLKEREDYILYLVLVDNADNISDKVQAPFYTLDVTAPWVVGLTAEAVPGGREAKLTFKPSEAGEYYYLARPKGKGSVPTTAEIISTPTGQGKATVTTGDSMEVIVSGLEPLTDYEFFVVLKDEAGNVSKDPAAKTELKTVGLDVPIVESLEAKALPGGEEVELSFKPSRIGEYFYLIRPKTDDPEPTTKDIISKHTQKGLVFNPTQMKEIIKKLSPNTTYEIYVVLRDLEGKVSEDPPKKVEVKTPSPDGPQVTNLKAVPMAGGKRVKLTFKTTKEGEYFYYVRLKSDLASPTVERIISAPAGVGKTLTKGDVEVIVPNLNPDTEYEIFVAMRDMAGYVSDDPAPKATVFTTPIDAEHPYIVAENGIELERDTKNPNEFFFYVSEKLDPKTANEIDNYDLSGTVIINSTGRQSVKPAAVKYEENGKRPRIRITVPANTGFVDKDTLVVTVSEKVTDLAELAFENSSTVGMNQPVRNTATYTHKDEDRPIITNVEAKKTNRGKNIEISYSADKAGTLYYLILPSSLNIPNLEAQDLYEEFVRRPNGNGKFNVTSTDTAKVYLGTETDPLPKPNITVVGRQMFDIDLTALEPDPDPFYSYSIYMVLRDRSGNLSLISKEEIITDSKPPFITELQVDYVPERDDVAELKFNSTEVGTVYYKAIPKLIVEKDEDGNDVIRPNPLLVYENGEVKPIIGTDDLTKSSEEREEAFKAIDGVQTAPMVIGKNKRNLTGLSSHQEYVVVVGVKDRYGNFTIKKLDLSIPETDPSQPNGNNMIEEYYADGTTPKVLKNTWTRYNPVTGKNEIIPKISTLDKLTSKEFEDIPLDSSSNLTYEAEKTFVLTFSEAITAENAQDLTPSMLEGKIQSNLAGYTIADIAWEDDTDISTWQKRRLVIKFNKPVTTGVKVDMDANTATTITDLANLRFMKEHSIAEYKTQIMGGFVIDGAGLGKNLTENTSLKATSNKLEVIVAIDSTDFDYNPRYYYVMTNKDFDITSPTSPLTKQHIISGINPEGNAPFAAVGSGKYISAGTKLDVYLWDDALRGKPNQPSSVFIEGQYVYMVLVDDYGNISNIAKQQIVR